MNETEVIEAMSTDVADENAPADDRGKPAASESVEVAVIAAPPPHADPLLGELSPVPARTELMALAQLATTFAHSTLVPKALQDKPADVLLVLLTARDLGLTVTTALRECHPIDGRVTVSPKLKLAIVRSRGLGRVWPDPANDAHSATWYATRNDDPYQNVYVARYSWSEAQRAGLVQWGCLPDKHDDKCKRAGGRVNQGACKTNWQNYPARMVSWRAMGALMDDVFGEVGTGLYSPDELGAITDDNGQPVIDISEVGELPGMVTDRQGAGPVITDPEEWAALAARIPPLPADQKAWLAEQWKDKLPRALANLTERRHFVVADALVRQAERAAGAAKPPEGTVTAAGPGEPVSGPHSTADESPMGPCTKWEECAGDEGHDGPCADENGKSAPKGAK